MIFRGVIVAALLLYATVIACVLWPRARAAHADPDVEGAHPVAAAARLEGLPFRGVAMQVQNVDKIDEYEKGIDEAAAVGFDSVSFVVAARQENGTSSKIFIDLRATPAPEQLTRLIQRAKSKKLRVVLMPIVLLDRPQGNEWRGTIHPDSWEDWWDSYRDVISHFVQVGEKNGVDLFVVGSELVSTEDKLDQWTRTIRMVRKGFKGKLTYSSNWDHYTSVTFWNQLDLVGMNSYWKLGRDRNVTVEEIKGRWRDIQKDLIAFEKKVDRPLIFLEVGWCSLANAAHEPWDYTRTDQALDLDLQKRLYEGFFESWHGNPACGGFMLWEWTLGDGGPQDKGYTPKNKPAQDVLRTWLAKPRWNVQ